MPQDYKGPGSAPPPKKPRAGGPPVQAGLAGGVAEAAREAKIERFTRRKHLLSRVPPMETVGKPITGRFGSPPSMKKGGVVKKTGFIRMHKNERVIPAHRMKLSRGEMRMTRRGGY